MPRFAGPSVGRPEGRGVRAFAGGSVHEQTIAVQIPLLRLSGPADRQLDLCSISSRAADGGHARASSSRPRVRVRPRPAAPTLAGSRTGDSFRTDAPVGTGEKVTALTARSNDGWLCPSLLMCLSNYVAKAPATPAVHLSEIGRQEQPPWREEPRQAGIRRRRDGISL